MQAERVYLLSRFQDTKFWVVETFAEVSPQDHELSTDQLDLLYRYTLFTMSHARVEEISDSDPSDEDISTLPSTSSTLIQAKNPTSQSSQSSSSSPPPSSNSNHPHKSGLSASSARPFNPSAPPADYKTYHCLYPLYFDASRSRLQGRRVSKENAVENPLAREIVDAVQGLGLKTVFEPSKCHPKDWGNPGRVRVALKEGGRGRVKNSTLLQFKIPFHIYPSFTSRIHAEAHRNVTRKKKEKIRWPSGNELHTSCTTVEAQLADENVICA